MRRPRDRLRFLVRVGDDDLPVDGDAGSRDVRIQALRVVTMLGPDRAIALDEGAIRLGRAEPGQVHVLRRGPGHAVDVARRVPERRVRALQRRQLHRHVVVAVVLAMVSQSRARHPHHEHLERLLEHGPRARRVESVVADLVRRHAATHSQLEPPTAQVIKHADLAQQPERRVERQQEDERPQADAPRPLRRRRQEHRGRRRHAERGGVMLGQVIAEESRRVRRLQELEPVLVELPERSVLPAVDPVEHPELEIRHGPSELLARHSRIGGAGASGSVHDQLAGAASTRPAGARRKRIR
jgi:hypothetical protein